MKTVFFILASFSMVACAGSLIIEKPINDRVYLYGLGVNQSHSTAEKLAMANLIQQISSKVSSEDRTNQSLVNGVANDSYTSDTSVSTLALELPSVETIKSVEKNGEWNILIRVKRSLVQLTIKNQLENMSDDFLLLLEDHSESPGPACWVAMKENRKEKPKFQSLISAYIGSGVSNAKTTAYSQQIKAYTKLFTKCKKRNRYRLIVENDSTGEFRKALYENLRSSDIKLTNSSKSTGVIVAKLEVQTKKIYGQQIVFLSTKLNVKDEFSNFISDTALKAKGSSFSSKAEAEKKAIKNLIKKIRKLNFSI